MGTIEFDTLRSESAVSLAGAFCGGLFLGILIRVFAPALLQPSSFPFCLIFCAVSGCIEFVKLKVRRRTSGAAAALAAADAIGLLAGFGVAQALFSIAP